MALILSDETKAAIKTAIDNPEPKLEEYIADVNAAAVNAKRDKPDIFAERMKDLPQGLLQRVYGETINVINKTVESILSIDVNSKKDFMANCQFVSNVYEALYEDEKVKGLEDEKVKGLEDGKGKGLKDNLLESRLTALNVKYLLLPIRLFGMIAQQTFQIENDLLKKELEALEAEGAKPSPEQLAAALPVWGRDAEAKKRVTDVRKGKMDNTSQEDYEKSELSFMTRLTGACEWTIKFTADWNKTTNQLEPEIQIRYHVLSTHINEFISTKVGADFDFNTAFDTMLAEKPEVMYMLLHTHSMGSWVRSPFSFWYNYAQLQTANNYVDLEEIEPDAQALTRLERILTGFPKTHTLAQNTDLNKIKELLVKNPVLRQLSTQPMQTPSRPRAANDPGVLYFSSKTIKTILDDISKYRENFLPHTMMLHTQKGTNPNLGRMIKRLGIVNDYLPNENAKIEHTIPKVGEEELTPALFQQKAFGNETRINHILLAQTCSGTRIKAAMDKATGQKTPLKSTTFAFFRYGPQIAALREWAADNYPVAAEASSGAQGGSSCTLLGRKRKIYTNKRGTLCIKLDGELVTLKKAEAMDRKYQKEKEKKKAAAKKAVASTKTKKAAAKKAVAPTKTKKAAAKKAVAPPSKKQASTKKAVKKIKA